MDASVTSVKERTSESAYEWFLELQVPVVLAVLWIAGVTLIGSAMLVLYSVGWLLEARVGA
jgi:hypothetical protein